MVLSCCVNTSVCYSDMKQLGCSNFVITSLLCLDLLKVYFVLIDCCTQNVCMCHSSKCVEEVCDHVKMKQDKMCVK